jgi:tagatose-1,6-bisphosphate aldolase non-catalytic subunit AgaZ/GatZ
MVTITPFTHTEGDYYDTLEAEFSLVENHFYILVIKDGTTIIYRDKIFCTDQNLVTFSVNNGQYVSNSTTNEFIVYE